VDVQEVTGSKLLTAEEKDLLKSKEIKFSKISSVSIYTYSQWLVMNLLAASGALLASDYFYILFHDKFLE
jgi:hypothetical protein